MKKWIKLIVIIAVIAGCVCLVGCGSGSGNNSSDNNEKSNNLRLKTVDIEAAYYKDSEGIPFDAVNATYYNVTEAKDVKVPINDYRLYIDGSQVTIKDGYITGDISIGKHKLNIEWEYSGNKESYEKAVKVQKIKAIDEAFEKLYGVWVEERGSYGRNFVQIYEEDGAKKIMSGVTQTGSCGVYTAKDCFRDGNNYIFECTLKSFNETGETSYEGTYLVTIDCTDYSNGVIRCYSDESTDEYKNIQYIYKARSFGEFNVYE